MTVLDATLRELESMGAVECVEGQTALALARSLDSGRNAMAAQGNAARLLTVMEELRRRRPAVQSKLDELRELRSRRPAV